MSPSDKLFNQFVQRSKEKKWTIVLVALLVALFAGFYTKSESGRYIAYSKIFPLSFNASGGAGSSLSSLKAQFGLTDKTDYEKLYNLQELVTSRTVSMNVVRSVCSNKKHKTLAHWILQDYNDHLKMFSKRITLKTKDSNELYYIASDLLLLNTEIVTDKTDFSKIITSFHDQNLSKEVNESILKNLSSLYIKLAIEKPSSEVEKLQVIRDSLKFQLDDLEKQIAGYQDANQLSVKYTTGIPQAKLLRDRAEVEQLYVTAVTAYQNANFKLLSERPIFQVLDFPGPPYEFKKPSAVKVSLVVFVLMGFILLVLINYKVFLNMIKQELSNS